jgi:hypothetical protein
MASEATQVVSLFISAVVAVVIFIALNRNGAKYRPFVWLGAALLLVGVTGIYPSWMAVQHHQSAVFAGLLAHTAMSPWLAVAGYAVCIAFGTILLFPFRRQK